MLFSRLSCDIFNFHMYSNSKFNYERVSIVLHAPDAVYEEVWWKGQKECSGVSGQGNIRSHSAPVPKCTCARDTCHARTWDRSGVAPHGDF